MSLETTEDTRWLEIMWIVVTIPVLCVCVVVLSRAVQVATLLLSGIFNSDDDKEERGASSGDDNDEILAELKKKQAELRALSHQNAIMLRHLHKQAKEELQSQELKKKMAAADAEVNVQDSKSSFALDIVIFPL